MIEAAGRTSCLGQQARRQTSAAQSVHLCPSTLPFCCVLAQQDSLQAPALMPWHLAKGAGADNAVVWGRMRFGGRGGAGRGGAGGGPGSLVEDSRAGQPKRPAGLGRRRCNVTQQVLLACGRRAALPAPYTTKVQPFVGVPQPLERLPGASATGQRALCWCAPLLLRSATLPAWFPGQKGVPAQFEPIKSRLLLPAT